MLRFAGIAVLFMCVACVACAKSSGSSSGSTPPPDGTTTAATAATAEPECPKDLSGSVGKPCKSNGQICSPPGAAVRMISCSGGKWVELNVPPGPNRP